MKQSAWRAWGCAAAMGLAAAMPATAVVVTFEDVAPSLFVAGDSFTSGGFSFTVGGFFGTVDVASALPSPPTGSDGQFYSGLNDSQVTLSSGNSLPTIVQGFDFSFVAPFPLGGPTLSPGRLVAFGIDVFGAQFIESWDFGNSNGTGGFGFISIDASSLGALSNAVQSVSFLACLYDGTGGCVNPAGNLAQFAIDNIHADLPEPTSLALVLVAMGVVGAARRRNSK